MERKLATLRKISEIKPIEGADAIELAVIDGWNVVTAKAVGHKVGDLVIYCEIDSFLPIEPEFEFLRKSSFKKMGDGTEGFRLRTRKLRNQVSQGVILPLSVLESITNGKIVEKNGQKIFIPQMSVLIVRFLLILKRLLAPKIFRPLFRCRADVRFTRVHITPKCLIMKTIILVLNFNNFRNLSLMKQPFRII